MVHNRCTGDSEKGGKTSFITVQYQAIVCSSQYCTTEADSLSPTTLTLKCLSIDAMGDGYPEAWILDTNLIQTFIQKKVQSPSDRCIICTEVAVSLIVHIILHKSKESSDFS